jgi:hypothetical protein
MFPAGAENPPILKLVCLYRMKEINGASLERAIVFPLRGESVSRISHGELLSKRERKEKKSKVPRIKNPKRRSRGSEFQTPKVQQLSTIKIG